MDATDGGPGSSEDPQGLRTTGEAAEPEKAESLQEPETETAGNLPKTETAGNLPETETAGGSATEAGRMPRWSRCEASGTKARWRSPRGRRSVPRCAGNRVSRARDRPGGT